MDIKSYINLGCKDFIFSFKSLDLSIVNMDFFFHRDDSFLFKPLVFSVEALNLSTNYVLRTIDNNLSTIVIDKSHDCRALDVLLKLIQDPFPNSLEDPISSWSLPVGCDAQPGDSGAPLFNSKDEIVGILWGGKIDKNFVSSNDLTKKISLNSKDIWQDFNFIIPSSEIKNQLQIELLEMNPNSLEYLTLIEFYKSL